MNPGQADINVGSETFTISSDNHMEFVSAARARTWEPETFRFIHDNCRPGTMFIDIGAWIGLMTLYACKVGAEVIAFEPDPVAFSELRVNLAANDMSDPVILNQAAGRAAGLLSLYTNGRLGDSTTSAVRTDGTQDRIEVQITPLADIAVMVPAHTAAVIKIDIEGFEYEIFDEIVRCFGSRKFKIHLSLHPRKIWQRRKRAMPSFLARLQACRETLALLASFPGYTFFREDGTKLHWWFVFRRVVRPRYTHNFNVIALPTE